MICEHCKKAIDDRQTAFSFGSEDRAAQRSQVFNALRKARAEGRTNVELSKICLRFGARIHELKHQEGHRISCKQISAGLYRYTLAAESW